MSAELAYHSENNPRCEAANDNAPSATLYYLHTDHLGRPKLATNDNGEVVWDGGLTTPFGQGITTMGAITQKLMFPGQYSDEETGYSHNWHRTYDPTLGRYLQADPIGLAGGLNRYAYVGGNPVGWVDPMGLSGYLTIYAKDGNGGIGHAGISFAPDGVNPTEENPCGCETFAFWPPFPGQDTRNGLNSNYGLDLAMINNPSTSGLSTSRIHLNDEEEKQLREAIAIAQNHPYTPTMQCTTFATSMWNRFSSEKLHAILPSTLKKRIDDAVPALRGPIQ